MSIVLRIDKGAPLTNAELDANFADLSLTRVSLGGDIGGGTSAPVVVSLRGKAVSTATPTTGQTLTWTGDAWTPVTPSNNSGLATVTVLDDLSPYFNNVTRQFTLKQDRVAITEGVNYVDNQDIQVIIGNRYYRPWFPQSTTLGPWIVDFADFGRTYDYRITGSTIKFNRSPESRQGADIRINNVSSSRRIKSRYPLSANSIALGD